MLISGLKRLNLPTYQLMSPRNWEFTNSHSCSDVHSQPHHYKLATFGTNRNTDTAAPVPGTDGSVSTARWPRPDPADHCPVTKRGDTCPDSHTAGSSCARVTTGKQLVNT